MKTKLHLSFKTSHLLFALFILSFTSCKKAYMTPESEVVTSSNVSNIATDGVVSVQPGILPPATPQSFIANGGTATVQYEFYTIRKMFI